MTDYLEFQEKEDALDLWEAARRLDDVLARLTVEDDRKTVRSGEEEHTGGLLEETERLDRALNRIQTLERENHPSAPAEELTAWEREAVRGWLSGTSPAVPAFVREEPLNGPAGRIPMGGASVSPMDWGTETVQAERLDLLFRRDSRRYDGGFFLY